MNCGLIGEKLGHSFSKIIHEQLTSDYTYDLFPLEKAEFEAFIQEKNFHGINVTIPYKISVIPYLQEIDNKAKAIGAVNTVLNKNGSLLGYNTDFDGFLYLLNRHQIDVSNKKVAVIGKGGASKAVLAVLKAQNAREVLTLYYKDDSQTISYEDCQKNHSDCQIIINTTPVGMFPNAGESPLSLLAFKDLEAVVDVIYNPISPDIVVQAKKRGLTAVGGLEMLVAQAQAAATIFLDKPFNKEVIDHIYRDLLFKQLNIVLIGMPSSGKTTVGELISETLCRPFFDSDAEIIKEIAMPIADYFKEFGEAAFRQIETAVIKKLSGKTGIVLSTGGGCVLNERNIDYLNQNSILFYIDRNIDNLLVDKGRPLSKSPEALKEMLALRLPLYQKYSFVTISNNTYPDSAAILVLDCFNAAVASY